MMMAFIVVRFVCPAVTAADQARMTTNGAMDVTACRDSERQARQNETWRHTGDPVAEQQADAVVWQRIYKDGAKNSDAIGQSRRVSAAALPVRRGSDCAEDDDD